MGGIVISDYAMMVGQLAQKIALGINDLWYGKRIPEHVFQDKTKSEQMRSIATSLSSLETRFKEYLKPYLPQHQWWLPSEWFSSLGKSIGLAMSGGTAKAVYTQLKEFEKELSDIGTEWSNITKLAKPRSTDVVDINPEKGMLGKLLDFAWDLVPVVAVGLGVWYGIPLLFNYLDQKTRIPENRLPRYAGGKRRSR